MTLGKIVQNYLEEHHVSARKFAENCNLSPTYIHYIVKEENPTTGKPIVPTLENLYKIARGMNITPDDLIAKMDDTEISLKNDNLSSDLQKMEMIKAFDTLTEKNKETVLQYIEFLKGQQK